MRNVAKTRVHELAKPYNVESKFVLEKLKEMGEFVKSPPSTIELPGEMKFKKAYGEQLKAAATAEPTAPAEEKPAAKKAPARKAVPQKAAPQEAVPQEAAPQKAAETVAVDGVASATVEAPSEPGQVPVPGPGPASARLAPAAAETETPEPPAAPEAPAASAGA